MSKICTSCGAEAADGTAFCRSCGSPLPADPVQTPPPNTYNQSAVYAQPAPNVNMYNVVSQQTATTVGGWIGWILLCSFLPLIGIIITICCANDESVKNWAKATLVIAAVTCLLYILFFVTLGASILSAFD